MQIEIPFTHQGQTGRVTVALETTQAPAELGTREGAKGLANCKAVIDYPGDGYKGLLGWVQLVCSMDNISHGREFEMDPFDPFDMEKRSPTPYCWYGITPTLFDAPSRSKRMELDWVAHSFLAASPLQGERSIKAPILGDQRIVTPLMGFAWGFQILDEKIITLIPITALTAADWAAHLPTLRKNYKKWQFREMSTG